MGTPNFHNVADTVFAVDLENEYDREDVIYDIQRHLTSNEFDEYTMSFGGYDPHELRSYPSFILGSLSKSKQYKDFEIVVCITLVLRTGYYNDANLDYHITFCVEDNETDCLSDIPELIADYVSDKRASYLSPFVDKWMYETRDAMIDKVEELYKQFSLPLRKIATLSNGEAYYEQIN